MQRIKYILNNRINNGTDEAPLWVDTPGTEITRPYTDADFEIAKAESYNGEYEIYDDGEPEPTPAPAGDDSVVWEELDAAYQEGVDSV